MVAIAAYMIGMDKPGLLAMVLSRGKDLAKVKIVNLRGTTELEQRRHFMKLLVVHPKVVLLRCALGEDIALEKIEWAIEQVTENERRYGVGVV